MKQDRQGARTVTDIERRYGTRFSEIMGIADDAREAANEARQSVQMLDENLSQAEIFNRLTNNGQAQGLYRDEDGNIYINASYLAGGVIQSSDGKVQIFLDGSSPIFNTGISVNGLIVRGDAAGEDDLFKVSAIQTNTGRYSAKLELFAANGTKLFQASETVNSESERSGVVLECLNQIGDRSVRIGSHEALNGIHLYKDDVAAGVFWIGSDGKSCILVDKINFKNVSWKDNGDGTYTLIGTD